MVPVPVMVMVPVPVMVTVKINHIHNNKKYKIGNKKMANLSNLNIDPNVKESSSFIVLDEGKYKAVITADKLKDTKKGDGKYLELSLQVIEGDNAGVSINDRLNIMNPSEQAQAIGHGTLKRICTALNVPFPPTDTTTLYGKPLEILVGIEEFESNREAGKMLKSNTIKSYNAIVKDSKNW